MASSVTPVSTIKDHNAANTEQTTTPTSPKASLKGRIMQASIGIIPTSAYNLISGNSLGSHIGYSCIAIPAALVIGSELAQCLKDCDCIQSKAIKAWLRIGVVIFPHVAFYVLGCPLPLMATTYLTYYLFGKYYP